ncbi:MAG: hypothetical protein NTW38_02745 [Candidatus Aminicenantes bacterium]|nr:hypothetical protein [Candidatus Aminicenantes bacterium]
MRRNVRQIIRFFASIRFLRALGPGLLILVCLGGPAGVRGQTDSRRPVGRFRAAFGLDSLERKFYKPEFHLSGPFPGPGRNRIFLDLSYLQKINGDMEGPVDFWIQTGLVTRLSDGFSVEASLNHFCRHQTSLFSSYILNLNELIGRVWVRHGNLRGGIGLGTYIGGSPGYDHLAVFNMSGTGFLFPELSFSGEIKWVNFSEVLYEAELAIALSPGAEVILAGLKPYRLPPATHLGVRFGSEGGRSRFLDGFDLAIGAYPFFDAYKLMVDGAFRLALLRETSRRFFLDIAFYSPLLTGSGFWDQFWPDRMMYAVSAEYERPLGRLFAALYGRYFADMPVDKAVAFRASAATGVALRNQPDFNRLDLPLRFDIRAGLDLKFKYDFGLKLGINTPGEAVWKAGLEVRLEANDERRAAEALVFLGFGRDISIRPFVGLRRVTPLAGDSTSDGAFRRILMAGISFYKWFD